MLENKMMRENGFYWRTNERQTSESEWRIRYAQDLAQRTSVDSESSSDHAGHTDISSDRKRSIWTMALDGRLGAAMLRMM